MFVNSWIPRDASFLPLYHRDLVFWSLKDSQPHLQEPLPPCLAMRRALKLCSSPVSGFPLGTSMHRVAEGRLLFRIYKGYLVEGGQTLHAFWGSEGLSPDSLYGEPSFLPHRHCIKCHQHREGFPPSYATCSQLLMIILCWGHWSCQETGLFCLMFPSFRKPLFESFLSQDRTDHTTNLLAVAFVSYLCAGHKCLPAFPG